VEREREDKNEYKLTLTVLNHVTHSFDARVVLSHPFMKLPKILYLSFTADESSQPPAKLNEVKEVSEVHREDMPRQAEVKPGASIFSYFLFIAMLCIIIAFLVINVFGCELSVSTCLFNFIRDRKQRIRINLDKMHCFHVRNTPSTIDGTRVGSENASLVPRSLASAMWQV
jgi:hypothetical protein